MKHVFYASLLAAVTGCNGPEATPPSFDQGRAQQEMGEHDSAEDLSSDMGPSCRALMQCPANTCGMVDDGCGGQLDCGGPKTCEQQGVACGLAEDGCGGVLDCGPCLCQNGVPVVEQCGEEGKGQVICDTPAGRCQLPQIPQGPANYADPASYATVLYVYPRVGRLDQIQATIDQAATLPKPALVALMVDPDGYQHYSHPLTMRDQVSLVGNFSQEGRLAGGGRQNVHVVTKLDEVNKRFVAMDASDINSPTWVAHIELDSVVAVPQDDPLRQPDTYTSPAGYDGYGMWIVKSPGLRLETLTVFQHAYSDSYPRRYSQPRSRVLEPPQSPPTEYWLEYDEVQQRWEAKGTSPAPPQPVSNTDCPQVQGGAGGLGAFAQGMTHPMIVHAQSGQPSMGGVPGGLGATAQTEAQKGADAPPAVMMQAPDGESVLVVPDPMYVPGRGVVMPGGHGQDGQDGAHGQSGGGGGGGHAQLRVVAGKQVWIPGSTGNPGSPGGCGGRGGQGGRPGAHRVGLLVVDSQGITLNQVRVFAMNGGEGEDGEQGGLGQEPAYQPLRQHMALVRGEMVMLNDASTGASGGQGGSSVLDAETGGSGGSGSGGVGGYSFGLFCVNTLLAPSLAEFPGTVERSTSSKGGVVFGTDKRSANNNSQRHWNCFPQ